MNKTDKSIVVCYMFLAISLVSVSMWLDSLYEKPHIEMDIPTVPIQKISFQNIITSRTHEQMFDVLTDVKNYPMVLPNNISSVKILETTDNSITAVEELKENFIKTKLTS